MLAISQSFIQSAVIIGALVGIIFALKYLIRLEQKILNIEVHVEHLVDQIRYNELSILDEEYKIADALGIDKPKKKTTKKAAKKTTKKKATKKAKK